jgi:antitoxin YefM
VTVKGAEFSVEFTDMLYYYLYNTKEVTMEAITYSHTRQHLAEIMNKVAEDRAPVLITRQAGNPVVMMSLQDFNALEETAYLMRSPKNAKRLMESIEQLAAQGGQQRELLPDAD